MPVAAIYSWTYEPVKRSNAFICHKNGFVCTHMHSWVHIDREKWSEVDLLAFWTYLGKQTYLLWSTTMKILNIPVEEK